MQKSVLISLDGPSLEALIFDAVDKAIKLNTPSQKLDSGEDEKPLNVEEAAHFLGLSRQTVYQNIDRIPHRKRFGRLYFFRFELLDYLNAGEGGNA